MPNARLYGPAPGTVGDRQVAQIPVTKSASSPIPIDRYFRNGKHPDADAMNLLCGQFNQGVICRSKEVFGYAGILGDYGTGLPTPVSGTRKRWRFAFHTSPAHGLLLCRVVLMPSKGTGRTHNSGSRLTIEDVSGAVITSVDFTYGNTPIDTTTTTGWQFIKITDKQITGLSPDTTYYGLVEDTDWGCIQSMSVAEMNSMTTYMDGYLPTNFTGETNVVATYRQNLAQNMPALWKRNCAPIWNWTDPIQAPSFISSTTLTNILDHTSTTYGSSIPGATVDLRGRARRSQTAVPVRIFVRQSDTTHDTGEFCLYRDSGTLVAQIPFTGTNEGWFSTDATLPAALTKLYPMARCTVGASNHAVYAFSVIMYE